MAETAKKMEPVKTMTPARTAETMTPRLVPPSELFEKVHKMYDAIARRAFEVFEENGRTFGKDWENWFKAEGELLQPVSVEMAEKGDDLVVRAEVPGFAANDLEVSLEGRRLTISGRKETSEERKEEKTLYRERKSNELMRVVELPMEVKTDKVAATLKDGVLEMRMPKAAGPRKVAITSKKG